MVKDITVVETNYTDYALVLKHKVFNREYTQVALYGETRACAFLLSFRAVCHRFFHPCLFTGRTQKLRSDVIQKFKAFALSQGLSRESILTPPPAGKV